MNILFLSAWCPLPVDSGVRMRISQLLRGLARSHTVDLLSFAPQPPDAESLQTLKSLCRDVTLIAEDPFPARPVGRLVGLLSSKPRSVVANHNPTMAAAVRGRAGSGYDLVIALDLHMAPYGLLLDGVPRILEGIELVELRDQQTGRGLRARLRYGLTWWKTRRYVADLLRRYQGATAVSPLELELIGPLAPPGRPPVVVPNGVDLAACSGDYGPPAPDTLIYPGAISYKANYDAVEFFARDILPRLRAERPAVELAVTGRATPEQIAGLPDAPGLRFTGFLDDVRPAVARAWAEVVPLRVGSGTRLKVLEALALGTPIVSTSKGIEGLDLQPEHDLLLADTPEQFARQTLRLLESPELRARLSAQGRQAAARHDWSRSVDALEGLIRSVLSEGEQPKAP